MCFKSGDCKDCLAIFAEELANTVTLPKCYILALSGEASSSAATAQGNKDKEKIII